MGADLVVEAGVEAMVGGEVEGTEGVVVASVEGEAEALGVVGAGAMGAALTGVAAPIPHHAQLYLLASAPLPPSTALTPGVALLLNACVCSIWDPACCPIVVEPAGQHMLLAVMSRL